MGVNPLKKVVYLFFPTGEERTVLQMHQKVQCHLAVLPNQYVHPDFMFLGVCPPCSSLTLEWMPVISSPLQRKSQMWVGFSGFLTSGKGTGWMWKTILFYQPINLKKTIDTVDNMLLAYLARVRRNDQYPPHVKAAASFMICSKSRLWTSSPSIVTQNR